MVEEAHTETGLASLFLILHPSDTISPTHPPSCVHFQHRWDCWLRIHAASFLHPHLSAGTALEVSASLPSQPWTHLFLSCPHSALYPYSCMGSFPMLSVSAPALSSVCPRPTLMVCVNRWLGGGPGLRQEGHVAWSQLERTTEALCWGPSLGSCPTHLL